MSIKCGTAFALLFVLCSVANPAHAQAGFMTSPNGSKYKNCHDPNEVRAEPLAKAPDLPDIPPYSGKYVFVDGLYHPSMNNGRKCVQGRYRTTDDSKTVLYFYKNALQSAGWKLEPDQRDQVEVAGRKLEEGRTVFIRARDVKDPKYRCEYFIRYSIVPLPKGKLSV